MRHHSSTDGSRSPRRIGWSLAGAAVLTMGGLLASCTTEPGADTENPAVTENAGDFDGDGRQQVLVPSTIKFPALLEQDKVGKVEVAPIDAELPDDLTRKSMAPMPAPGDFDGDGHADLAFCAGERDRYSLLVLFGGADGWSEIVDLRRQSSCDGLAAGDGDGDGSDDLFVSGSKTLTWASPGADARSPNAWDFERIERAKGRTAPGIFGALAVGDVDGDGRDDLINERYADLEEVVGSSVQVRLAADDFRTPKKKQAECGLDCRIRVGDLEGDDRDDLVVFNGGEAMIWSATAEGIDVDEDPRLFRDQDIGMTNVRGMGKISPLGGGLADVDGDGADDLLFGLRDESSGDRGRDLPRVLVVPGGTDGPRTERTYQLRSRDPVYRGGPSSSDAADSSRWSVDVRRAELDGDAGQEVVLTLEGERRGRKSATYLLDADDRRGLDRQRQDHEPVPDDQRAAPRDLNGDGVGDLILTAGGDGGKNPLSVLFADPDEGGYADGRTVSPKQTDTAGLKGAADTEVSRTTSGDFDADGHADLAICLNHAPTVMFGSRDGLREEVRLKRLSCQGIIEAADLNKDGYSDLVIGANGEGGEPGSTWLAGGPDVRKPSGWVAEQLHGTEVDGGALGDVNGDGRLDAVFTSFDRPKIRTYLGTKKGFTDGNVGGKGLVTTNGLDLDVGDLNGDGFDDLAIGSEPFETVDDRDETIMIWYGSDDGLRLGRKAQLITASDVGIDDGSRLTGAIAIGETDDDGRAELAVGARETAVDGVDGAGVVAVLPGGTDGPAFAEARLIDQDDVGSAPQTDDAFGSELDYQEVAPDAGTELVVSSSGEDSGAGRVHVLGSERTWRITPEDAGMRTVQKVELGLGGVW